MVKKFVVVLILAFAALAVAQSPPGGFVSPPAGSGNVSTTAANTYGAFLQDFSAATWKVPQGAGFTATANSNFGLDTTSGSYQMFANTVSEKVMLSPLLNGNAIPKVNNTAIDLMTNSLVTDNGTTLTYTGTGGSSSPAYSTATNCNSSASPAVCGSAAAGSFVLAAAATTVTVNTTAVTANSQIIVVNDDSLGTRLSVTCNTALDQVFVSGRVPATSFTITGTAPVTNPNCYSYIILN